MSQLIQVTSFSPVSNPPTPIPTGAASTVVINVDKIISVKTRATAYRTTGITNVIYELPVNNTSYQIELIVTETQAAILAAANAALITP